MSSITALHYACVALGLDYHKANPDKTHDKNQQLVSLIHKMLGYGADPRKLNVYQHTPLELLQEELAPLDFELYQETLPYRIARVLNLPPDLTIQWCKNEEPREQTKFGPINKLYTEYQQAQKFFDSLSSNQRRTDEEINEERVAVHRKYGNALKVFNNILVDNMFLFTVGMIKRNHLYGAQKRWDIHELERKVYLRARKHSAREVKKRDQFKSFLA